MIKLEQAGNFFLIQGGKGGCGMLMAGCRKKTNFTRKGVESDCENVLKGTL